MNLTENMIFEVVAGARSVSQKGDISKFLEDQGFFGDKGMPKSLKERDPQWSGGNPVDVKGDFFKQNPE